MLNQSKRSPQSSRICAHCGTADPILSGEPIWPPTKKCSSCGEATPIASGFPLFAPDLADTVSGFDPKSFEFLAEIEDEHFWFVPRNRLLTGLIEKFFPQAKTVLEIGCGNGTVLSALAASSARRQLVGSELHPSGLTVAAQRLGSDAELVQMDARRIMADSAFDVIGAYDVIEHIAEDEDVIRSAHRALKVGGGMIIAVPQHPWLWSTADEVAYHQRRYERGEMEMKLTRNGFKVVFSTSYCVTLLPMMIVSRMLEKRRQKRSGNQSMSTVEAKPPTAINEVLKAVLQLEVSSILKGLTYPAGGSRVVVAVKQ